MNEHELKLLSRNELLIINARQVLVRLGFQMKADGVSMSHQHLVTDLVGRLDAIGKELKP